MLQAIAKRFILWSVKRAKSRVGGKVSARWVAARVVTFEDRFEFLRFEPFALDERVGGAGRHRNRPPWWRPFNAFVHWWRPDKDAREPMHDHPRWSITIVLRGRIIERTPWSERELRPGSIVIRSRRAIHSFTVPPGFAGKTWTMFVVGRRNHPQNTYLITPQGSV